MKSFFTVIVFFISLSLSAQDDLMDMLEGEANIEKKSEKVFASFKGIRLINANTIETTKKKTLEFRITHRFGNMKIGEEEGTHTFWGMDNASNIRFSFDYGITDKLSIGIGRSKVAELIDGNLKFRFLEQKTSGIPLSIAYFTNAAITPVTNITNKFENRWSYAHQLIIASKLNRSISLELLPTLIHRNYVDGTILHPSNSSTDENDLFALGFAGRFKITKRMAFIIDYFLPFSQFRDGKNGYYNALGVGIEIETGGHVFHINLTNSSGIIENDFIINTTDSWSDGNYKLGFNISRVFSF
jgi:hypothetical protein